MPPIVSRPSGEVFVRPESATLRKLKQAIEEARAMRELPIVRRSQDGDFENK